MLPNDLLPEEMQEDYDSNKQDVTNDITRKAKSWVDLRPRGLFIIKEENEGED